MEAAQRWRPYCGEAPGPEVWLSRWNTDPVLAAILLCMAFALWARPVGPDPGDRQRRTALRGAWVLAVLLYVSPLCALSSAFFTARVVHHMALVFLLAPLLAIGLERRLLRLPAPLWAGTAVAAAAFWAWHAPAPYASALSSVPVFVLMQCTLLASATVFWQAVRRAKPASAMAAILVSSVQMGLLGALITFASRPLYAPHFGSALGWGVLPLEDQQLAGIVMWAPGSLAYLAAALWIGRNWLRGSRERNAPRDGARAGAA